MTDRRCFIARLGLATAAVGLAPGALLAHGVLQTGVTGPSAGNAREAFLARLNQWFSFIDPRSGRRQRMQLVTVEPGPIAPDLDQFSLIFRGDPGSGPAAGTYVVSDGSGESFALYLQPDSLAKAGDHLRADFCLVLPA